jgi:serine/threonine protein phosphatase PrpC
LSGVVPQERVASIIGQSTPLDEICRNLVDAANQAGGPDNITVAMLQIDVA